MSVVNTLIEHRAHPFLLKAETTALEAARFLRKHHIGGAPVVENGKLAGFCSERDLVFRVMAEKRDPEDTKVVEIMSRDVVSATPDSKVQECESLMQEAHVRHLPIVKDGEVVACLSLRDLIQSELAESETQVECLSEYIRGDVYVSSERGGKQSSE